MLDTDVYTNGERVAQSENLRQYAADITGFEVAELAAYFRLTTEPTAAPELSQEKETMDYQQRISRLLKTKKYQNATAEKQAAYLDALPRTREEKTRNSKKYLAESTTEEEKRQLLRGKRRGGGGNDTRTVLRWFTRGTARRSILPPYVVGKTRLDFHFETSGNAADRVLARVLLAQTLTSDGIEREPISDTKIYDYDKETNSLADALDFCRLMELQQQDNEEGAGQPFGAARGWVSLRTTGHKGNWKTNVRYQIIPSEDIGEMRDERKDANTSAKARAYKEVYTTDGNTSREAKAARQQAAQEVQNALRGSLPDHQRLINTLVQFSFIEPETANEFEPGAVVCALGTSVLTWHTFARVCSSVTRGRWFARNDGATWNCGKKNVVFMDTSAYRKMKVSRMTVSVFGGDCLDSPAPTVSGLARQVLSYVMDKGKGQATDAHRFLVDGKRWGYVSCEPGEQATGEHWDATAFYYTLATRCPSPIVTCREGEKPIFGNRNAPDAARWREVLARVKNDKPLRNTLIGCMATGAEPGFCWQAGKLAPTPAYSTDFAPVGLLIARAGWEITRAAAVECESRLSVTDCVITSGGEPAVYRRLGLPTKLQHKGAALICSPTTFQIGGRETLPFQAGDRSKFRIPHADKPQTEFYKYFV